MTQKVPLGHINFTLASATEAPHNLIKAAVGLKENGMAVNFANAYTIALARADESYRQVLNMSAFVFADGRPVAWMSRLLHRAPHLHQVRGPEFFRDVFRIAESGDIRHYLLGSTPDVLEKLVSNLKRDFPHAAIVGSYSPPFRSMTQEELAAQDSAIESSGANVVWVGLGTPKQDLEVARLASSLPVVAVAIGAAFDFSAGTKREAPRWLSPLGLEWTFRLITEPRRLWKRYLFGNIGFVKACIEQKLKREVSGRA